jgi:hypothetical protein
MALQFGLFTKYLMGTGIEKHFSVTARSLLSLP